jgi:hypothetical protein
MYLAVARSPAACALLAVFLLAAALGGCGGDVSSEARRHIENGEQVINRSSIEESEEKIQELSAEVFSAFRDAAASRQPLDRKTVRDAERLLVIYNQLTGYYDDARSEFENVADLEGVEDYKTYADMQIQSVDLSLESIAALKTSVETALATQVSTEYDADALIQRLKDLAGDAMDSLRQNDAIRKQVEEFGERKGI